MDEFDHALMEALNEAVPPAEFSTNLAERLTRRMRHRTRFWKLLLALGLFSAATAAVVTVTTLSGDETEETAAETAAPHMESRHLGGDTSDWDSRHLGGDSPPSPSTLNPSTSQHLNISTTQQGDPQVQSTTLKKAAALTGAIALAAATPTRADGYQFIGDGKSAFKDNGYEDDTARQNWGGAWQTPSDAHFSASSIPVSTARTASSRVMAGPFAKFFVPKAIFLWINPGIHVVSDAMPRSTTSSSEPEKFDSAFAVEPREIR